MSRRTSNTGQPTDAYRTLLSQIGHLQEKASNRGALINLVEIAANILPKTPRSKSISASLRSRADIRNALDLLVQAGTLDSHELRYKTKPATLARGQATGDEEEEEIEIDGEGQFVRVERGYGFRHPLENMVKERKKSGLSAEDAVEEVVGVALKMLETYQASKKTDAKGKGRADVKNVARAAEVKDAPSGRIGSGSGRKRKEPSLEVVDLASMGSPALNTRRRSDPPAGHTRSKDHSPEDLNLPTSTPSKSTKTPKKEKQTPSASTNIDTPKRRGRPPNSTTTTDTSPKTPPTR
ncbi:hypothetical protein HK097_005067, partial [Rhizophlyctis rosea]